jgi:cysteinyl-tRNA synthetase
MLKLYNSLGKQIEDFVPISETEVGMYTCGPTVYSYVTIGNWRTYTLADLLARTLSHIGYEVKHVMNITDVGHLTGDNDGDANTGEDRLEKASAKEGKTAWDIAEFYTEDFLRGFSELNLLIADVFPKATDHIPEQIEMVEKIIAEGFGYTIDDGIYFDVAKYEEQTKSRYGEISNLDQLKEGARVEVNPQKKDARDFALWKFSPTDVQRQMEWDSPWGKGFPGWHIECSAMSIKYLGEQFDLHLGGEDLRSTHHPNEIVQTEAVTKQKPFVKYWLHGAFLMVDGGKMGKSKGNAYTLQDLYAKGFSAMDLRYFYLTGHYRKTLTFTWEALSAARSARRKLAETAAVLFMSIMPDDSPLPMGGNSEYEDKFKVAISNDLNFPQALAVVWELINDDTVPTEQKLRSLLSFDEVLGLNLEEIDNPHLETDHIPQAAQQLLEDRKNAREAKDWKRSDDLRDQLLKDFNIEVLDGPDGQKVRRP